MKTRTKVRAGAVLSMPMNRNAKKLTLKRARGLTVKTGVKSGCAKW